jgi:transposase InsO family protein
VGEPDGPINPSVLFYLDHPQTGHRFLIDSGATVSILTPPAGPLPPEVYDPRVHIVTATGGPIPQYGRRKLRIDFGLTCPFDWTFYVAGVQSPIIGADFLARHGLLVDVGERRLIERATLRSTEIFPAPAHEGEHRIHVIARLTAPDAGLLDATNVSVFFSDLFQPIALGNEAKTAPFEHHIVTDGARPVFSRPRRLAPDREAAAKKHFEELCTAGICRPSDSPWASPLHIVPKPDGSQRNCGDYRGLNVVTKDDRYPMRVVQDMTNNLHGAVIFSKIDLRHGFYHIPVAAEDVPKTAITTPFGLFEFIRMPFGLKNAPQTFNRYMAHVLKDLKRVSAFADDLLIGSRSLEEHKRDLLAVLERLRKWNLRINGEKSVFFVTEVEYLGFRVQPGHFGIIPERFHALAVIPLPKDSTALRRFNGMVNYYRRFIPHCSELLVELTKVAGVKGKGKPITWTPSLTSNFRHVQSVLLRAVRELAYPTDNGELRLITDASKLAAGAALEQLQDDVWVPLGYYSCKFNDTEVRYATFDRELLAMYRAVLHFRHMLEARAFHVLTDHKPLTHALDVGLDRANDRQLRQLDFIARFTRDVRFVPGVDNVVADILSRDVPTPENIAIGAVYLSPDEAGTTEAGLPILNITNVSFSLIAGKQEVDSELARLRTQSGQKFITTPAADGTLVWCETSTGRPRPYLPPEFRRVLFDSIHGMAHPGRRATQRLITARYFWPSMKAEICRWVAECPACAVSRVDRHIRPPISQFVPAGRFRHVHADIVGPLPFSQNKQYMFTFIDRQTRWVEAVPTHSITAEAMARAFVSNWVSRFGAPETLSSDRGAQYTSELFAELNRVLGTHHIKTTAYHPEANGILERFHRSLGDSLTAVCSDKRTADWAAELPIVLLSLRSTLKEDLGASPAELLYGESLVLPPEMITPSNGKPPDADIVRKFREAMHRTVPTNPRPTADRPVYLPKTLTSADYVYVLIPTHHHKLAPRYEGPFRVLAKLSDQVYRVDLPRGPENICTKRLKPAPVEAVAISLISAAIIKLVTVTPRVNKTVSWATCLTRTSAL